MYILPPGGLVWVPLTVVWIVAFTYLLLMTYSLLMQSCIITHSHGLLTCIVKNLFWKKDCTLEENNFGWIYLFIILRFILIFISEGLVPREFMDLASPTWVLPHNRATRGGWMYTNGIIDHCITFHITDGYVISYYCIVWTAGTFLRATLFIIM